MTEFQFFEWDEEKNSKTVKRRGISFDDAIDIFRGPTLEAVDDRHEYGEVRILAFGETNSQVLAVVYTVRGDACRIISARKARRNERDAYYAALLERPPDRTD